MPHTLEAKEKPTPYDAMLAQWQKCMTDCERYPAGSTNRTTCERKCDAQWT